jgi:hypothetical protein
MLNRGYVDVYKYIEPVVPSGMQLHTSLVPSLLEKNKPLAVRVIAALNRVDRSKKDLYHHILGSAE